MDKETSLRLTEEKKRRARQVSALLLGGKDTYVTFQSLGIDPKDAEKHIQSVPEQARRGIAASLLGVATPKEAIRSCCKECVGFEDTVASISECKSWRCPLWRYRPFQKGENELESEE